MDKGVREIESAELSIWFFCGVLMLAYGVVLLITGIMEFNHPPPNEVLLPWLESLHPTLWWGVLLTIFGGFYSIRFRPGIWIRFRDQQRQEQNVNSGALWRNK